MHYLISLLFLCSCSYKWSPDQDQPTVAVPYIIGDDDGTLTSEIIRTITTYGLAKVQMNEADYLLKICIGCDQNQTVGYRRDRQKVSGKIRKNIVACEGRRAMTLTATLYEGTSDCIAAGPFTITADSDYDYVDGDSIQDLAFINSDGVSTTVLPFSLGQLEPAESAQEATTKLLYERLARKIAETIFSRW